MRVASFTVCVALLSSACFALTTGRAAEPTAPPDAAPQEHEGKKDKLSDAQIKQILIEESIAAFSGNCPCPYNLARNGSRCGRRSAYSRPGGEAPLCYPKDVTAEMVQQYRDSHH